eukprot:g5510.t1
MADVDGTSGVTDVSASAAELEVGHDASGERLSDSATAAGSAATSSSPTGVSSTPVAADATISRVGVGGAFHRVEQGGDEPGGGMIKGPPPVPPESAGAGVTPERDRAMQPMAPGRPLRPPDPG